MIYIYIFVTIGPILDDRLKEKFLKPLNSLSCVCVCLSVCPSVRGLQNTPFNIWTLGHEKKRLFFFSKFSFYALYCHFSFFPPYITLVNFGFQATGHSFSPRNDVISGLRKPCRNWRLLRFLKIPLNSMEFVRVFRSHQKSQAHDILGLGQIWANIKHNGARFSIFLILRGRGGPIWSSVKNPLDMEYGVFRRHQKSQGHEILSLGPT